MGHFLQSQEWEKFQKAVGREVFRIDGALVIKLPLAFGKSYLYSAGVSPVKSQKSFAEIAKQENAVFLKSEPMVVKSTGTVPDGFQKSQKEVQPQKTIIFDITKPEDELLAQMHEKTRYNIRLSARKGVKIQNLKTQNSDIFWHLLQKTSERDRFSTHTREYYERLLALPMAQLFAAEYRGEIIAANIVMFHEGRATYLHGASDYQYRNLMAPYLLHWEIIRYAKEHGCTEYDLWGIDEKKWPGVTRFKRGFGGREIEYIGSYDYVFQSMWYKLYSLRNTLR